MHGIIIDLIHAKYHVMYFQLLACCIVLKKDKVEELLKERHNSIANALELRLSYTNLCYAFHVIPQLLLNTFRPRQNGRHFADDMFKCIFFNENVWIPIEISLKFVPKGPINNIPALVQIMAWRHPGDKPLSEPMIVSSLTHICVAWPQWVNRMTYIVNAMTAEGISSHDNDLVCMAYSITCAGRVKPILIASAKQLLWEYICMSFIHQATL